MEASKSKKVYLWVNIPLIAASFILLFSPLIIKDRWTVYYIGVIYRILLGIWSIFNAIWNFFTEYYSFFKNNKFEKSQRTPKWAWWLVFIAGVICLITAFMGFGFNDVQRPV